MINLPTYILLLITSGLAGYFYAAHRRLHAQLAEFVAMWEDPDEFDIRGSDECARMLKELLQGER